MSAERSPERDAEGRSRGLTASERGLFLVLALLPLVPLWWFRYFPSQDGPAHLEIASVLGKLLRDDGLFARYFAINRAPEPNWLIYPPLTLLLGALPSGAAEKLLISLYLIALPLSMLYAIRALRPAAAHVAFLGLPFALNYPLHMGFYNFALSLAAFFLIVGYRERCAVPMSPRQTTGLALLFLLAYFCHPVSLGMAMIAVGWSTIADLAPLDAGIRSDRWDWRRIASIAARPILAATPSLALLLTFVARQNNGETPEMSFATLARHLGVLYSLVSYGRAEMLVSVGLLAMLALSSVVVLRARLRRARPSWPRPARGDGFLAAAAVTLALYFLLPAGLAGGGYVNQRLQLFIFFFVLLWLAARPEVDRLRRATTIAGAVLAVGSVAIHAGHYARIDGYLDEYLSGADRLEPSSTLLPLSFDHRGAGEGSVRSRRIYPFEHAAGRLAAERGLVDLNDYQASRGYFPVVYRAECDPYLHLGSVDELSAEWPIVDLTGYGGTPVCAVDYVLVWAAGAEAHTRHPLFRQLGEGFERVFVSRRGLVEIYRRIGAGDGAPQSAAQR